MNIGMFLSKTVYFAFNSLSFCNRYIRAWYVPLYSLVKPKEGHVLDFENFSFDESNYEWVAPYNAPILNEVNFMQLWGILMILIALYVMFTQNEKNDRIQVSTEDEIRSMKEMFITIKSFVFNKNMITMNFIWLCLYTFCSFTPRLYSVYLLDELNYSQAKFSFILALVFPCELIASFFFSKLIFKYSYETIFYVAILSQVVYLALTNVALFNYATIMDTSELAFDAILIVLTLVMSISHAVLFNAKVAIFNKVSDPKLGSVHLTLVN